MFSMQNQLHDLSWIQTRVCVENLCVYPSGTVPLSVYALCMYMYVCVCVLYMSVSDGSGIKVISDTALTGLLVPPPSFLLHQVCLLTPCCTKSYGLWDGIFLGHVGHAGARNFLYGNCPSFHCHLCLWMLALEIWRGSLRSVRLRSRPRPPSVGTTARACGKCGRRGN